MKKQYIIIQQLDGKTLYFCENVAPIFTVKRGYAERYNSVKTAQERANYAELFAQPGGKIIIIEL